MCIRDRYTSNITIRNASPLELENVQVKFNGAETVTIGAMQSGEKRVIEIPEEAKPAVTVQAVSYTHLVLHAVWEHSRQQSRKVSFRKEFR